MPDKPFTNGTEYEALTAFFGGVNSGLNPLLLQKDQLAFATNTTVRGGFITHRPPYRKLTLDFVDTGAASPIITLKTLSNNVSPATVTLGAVGEVTTIPTLPISLEHEGVYEVPAIGDSSILELTGYYSGHVGDNLTYNVAGIIIVFEVLAFTVAPTTTLQDSFELGYYQGGVPYRPDFGNHSLMAAISGKLFKLAISENTAVITDVSVPGDPSPALLTQSWLWQAEKWVIWQDGLSLPVFYNGVTSRRSLGPSQLLGTTTAIVPANVPAIGATTTVTLTTPYIGPVGVPVSFNNALYQATGQVTSVGVPAQPAQPGQPATPPVPIGTPNYTAILTNRGGATPGTVPPIGSEIYVRPNTPGKVLATPTPTVVAFGTSIKFNLSSVFWIRFHTVPAHGFGPSFVPATVVANNDITVQTNLGTRRLRPTSVSGHQVTACQVLTAPNPSFPALAVGECGIPIDFNPASIIGNIVTNEGTTSPNVLAHTTLAPFTNPVNGDGVLVTVNDNYLGGFVNYPVWILDDQYDLTEPIIDQAYTAGTPASPGHPAIPAIPPSTTLYLVNLNDTPGGLYVVGDQITSVPELPTGRMGCYVMGRNWMSLVDGISFIAGNIVGGEAGTQAESYRDAVLHTTENDYLDTGTFRLPGSGDVITALLATANLDASMGQGALIVCTANSIFTCNAPVDRTTWQALTFPILAQTLLGSGALAQQSTFPVNSDTFMRAIDGWRSYKIARRNFSEEWGNTPITREMERVFNLEDKTLIPYVSGILFDNRVLFGARPQSTASGISSTVTVALNFDPVSSIAGKSPPIYDGAWGNLNVLQFMRAVVDSVDRAFAFAANRDTNRIELWELLPQSVMDDRLPPSLRVLADIDGATETPITWNFETSVLFKETPGRPLLQLLNGEIRVSDVVGNVDFQVWYKADNYPCWTKWHLWSICATVAPNDESNLKPGYNPRMGLGEPKVRDVVDGVEVMYCDEFTQRPLREGYVFQFKISIRGHCKFIGMTVAAVRMPEPSFAKPICEYSQSP